MVNHYIYNHPEHHASIASILDANTAPHNALLFLLHIGQTFFKVSNDGKNLTALRDFIFKGRNSGLDKYGFFAEATPGAAYTAKDLATPTAKIG
jgi:hypothetical protein